jgi:hypothetical protein
MAKKSEKRQASALDQVRRHVRVFVDMGRAAGEFTWSLRSKAAMLNTGLLPLRAETWRDEACRYGTWRRQHGAAR